MSSYNRLVFLKQLRHLLLAQPNGIFTQTNLQANGLIGLIHYYLAAGVTYLILYGLYIVHRVKVDNRSNVASKREKSQACLNSFEREQLRRLLNIS